MPMPSGRRFSKARRVRRRAEYQAVFDRGCRVHGRFFTILMAPRGPGGSRLGIVASRKLGDAVERNRAKRLIRELFRHSGILVEGVSVDAVVIPKRELLDAPFPAIEADFAATCRRGLARLQGPRHG